MDSLRIYHLDSERTWRGGEQQVSYLMQGLCALQHENILIAPSGSEIALRTANFRSAHYAIEMRNDIDIISIVHLARLLKKDPPHILHTHTARAHTIAAMAKRLSGKNIPLIVSRRVDFPLKTSWIQRWKYQQANFYLPISEAIRKILCRARIPSDIQKVVYSSVDSSRFQGSDGKAIRKEFSIADDTVVIGSVGVCEDRKDHKTLIKTIPLLLQRFDNVCFMIVGDGPKLAMLKQVAASLNITKHCIFTGFRNDIPALLKAFDVFVLIPKMEGLGSAIIEAECCSLPIVATPVGGIPELVEDGSNGFLVPVGDHKGLAQILIRLTKDQELRTRMGKESYKIYERSFTSDKMVEETLQVYTQLLENQ